MRSRAAPVSGLLPVLAAGLALLFLYAASTAAYDQRLFRYAVMTACFGGALLLYGARTETLQGWLAPPAPRPTRHARLLHGLGLAVLAGTLSFLEWQQPYYFTQEDTHTVFLPVIIQAARGLFEEGVFPTWNGYALLGTPTTTLGIYALTYPLCYLCYAAARFLLGNEFLTLEVFAWVHLAGGYTLTFLMLRRLQVRPGIAAAAALCFVLLGYNLIAGRSWYFMLPTVLWLPALGLALAVLMTGALPRGWWLGTGVVIGLYFHSGNVQMWTYAMMLWGIGMLWVTAVRGVSAREAGRIALAGLTGLILMLPLAVPQTLETKDLPRGTLDITIAHGLSNMLVPWPLVTSPPSWNDYVNNGTLFFSGGVFIALCFLRFALEAACLGRCAARRPQLVFTVFPLLSLLAFIYALGTKGLVWTWLEPFLPFSKFRMPLRMLPIVTFFMLITGAVTAEAALQRRRRRRFTEHAVAAAAAGLAVFNAIHCIATFGFNPDRPYPALPEAMKPFQAVGFTTRGRVFPVAQTRWYVQGSSLTQMLNYPSVYRIPSITGSYFGSPDATSPEFFHAWRFFDTQRELFYREFGVEWVLVATLPGPPPVLRPAELAALKERASRVVNVGVADAYDIRTPETKPIAFVESQPHVPLPYRLRNDGLDIDLTGVRYDTHPVVVAGFVHRRWMEAFTDEGRPVPLHADAYGRIVASLPDSGKRLSIRYCPPWHYGLLPALVLLLLVWAAARPVRRPGEGRHMQRLQYKETA